VVVRRTITTKVATATTTTILLLLLLLVVVVVVVFYLLLAFCYSLSKSYYHYYYCVAFAHNYRSPPYLIFALVHLHGSGSSGSGRHLIGLRAVENQNGNEEGG